MQQQLSREFAKARGTLTIKSIVELPKTFTELKIQKTDYFFIHSKSF